MLGRAPSRVAVMLAATARWRSSGRELAPSAHALDRLFAEEGWIMHVAIDTKRWTLDELHSLPDDGNKYELVRGDLFVTPAPSGEHESILAALSARLTAYVVANKLGLVYRPRAVLRFEDSEVEPDLMVRQPWGNAATDWETAPLPTLVVEVLSPSTRNRDRMQKRTFYADARVPEYWIIDPERKTVTVVARNEVDRTVRDVLVWYPPGADEPLEIRLADVFIDSN